MTRKITYTLLYSLLAIGITVGLCTAVQAAPNSNTDPPAKWGWASNAGWIDMEPPGGAATICSDHLEGYAWGENVGWIRLGTATGCTPHTYTNASSADYGVNRDGAGNLSGYAWGANVGWIDFAPAGGGVRVDPATGDYSGYAWGENVGWIKLGYAAPESNVDPESRWAWSTDAGWIDFNPLHGGVTVCPDHLEGYAWGENVGWIRLGTADGCNTHTYANSAPTDYGVNRDSDGTLSGYAWGTDVGWIDFAPADGGVHIDPATGQFVGHAWGENVGWVSFHSAGPVPYGVSMKIYRIFLSLAIKQAN